MKEKIIPYIRIDQIKKFIIDMPKEKCKISELTNKFGRSNVANALPTLTLLKLIKYDKKEKNVILSERGNKFRIALTIEDYKIARKLLKDVIDELELFMFIKGLLERKGILSNEEIGKELAFKYNKIWKNPITYRAYGSACASILGFTGYGIYDRGILRKGNGPLKKERHLPPPYLSYNKIIKILNEIQNEEVDLNNLSKRLETSKNRLGSELSVCIELGVIEKIATGKFIITKKGNRLIDPLNENKQKEIWKEVLLNSRYRKIITLLNNREFSFQEFSQILKHHFGNRWKEQKTIITYAKKFLNWLNKAEIIRKEDNKYKLTQDVKSLINKEAKQKSFQGIGLIDYYSIGKNVGIISTSNKFEEIKDSVSALINICKNDENLREIIELMNEHFDFFKNMKFSNGNIFFPYLKLLEKKLGVEMNV